ncbi:MAG: carbonic anhydrase [Capsulimonadaceae bacterium]|nr:carbonic anhydrase [Capsulimonadaceae bacterium]
MSERSSTDRIIEELTAGNARFLQGHSIKSTQASLNKLKSFAVTGQFPKAIVLCCSDSRAPVEIIFDQDIGDLFVIRVAGNIVAPSLVGSVEFAASTYGTSLVLVMGHSQCGAVTATLKHVEDPLGIESENLHDLVARIKPHIYPIAQIREMSFEEKLRRSVHANVLASVAQLSSSSRLIEGWVRDGKLTVVGAVLDLSTGAVHFIDT